MSKIKTYEDLDREEIRLMSQLRSHEVLIKEDLAGLKQSLKPVGKAYGVFQKMATRDHTGPLANFGIDFGIDLFVRKFVLARAGWFTKILIPFLVKNYSSHIISDEHKGKLAQKIQNLFNKIRPKKNPEPSSN